MTVSHIQLMLNKLTLSGTTIITHLEIPKLKNNTDKNSKDNDQHEGV